MLVLSRTSTRGSWRNEASSCPCPTSTATTWDAPRRSRQSANPPVEAPASRGAPTARDGSERIARAASKLLAAACDTNRRAAGSTTTTGSDSATRRAGLSASEPPTSTRPLFHQGPRGLRGRRPALAARARCRACDAPVRESGARLLRPGLLRPGLLRSRGLARRALGGAGLLGCCLLGPAFLAPLAPLPDRWVALRPAACVRARTSATFLASSSTLVSPSSLSCCRTSPRTVETSASERSGPAFTRSSTSPAPGGARARPP